MARFSPEDKETIWDMREAGVPVKRIAKHLGRQNFSLRKFIADAGGTRPTARERSELRLSSEEREEISRGLAAGYSIRAIAEALGRSPSTVCREVNANGGRRKYRALVADRAAVPAGAATQAGQARPVPPAPRRRRAQARGQVVTPADLGVVGSGVPRSPGDAGVPRDHLPVALRPEPWCAAQRAPFVPAQWSGHAPGQGLHQGQPHRPGQAQEHGDDLRAPRRGGGPGRARATGKAT